MCIRLSHSSRSIPRLISITEIHFLCKFLCYSHYFFFFMLPRSLILIVTHAFCILFYFYPTLYTTLQLSHFFSFYTMHNLHIFFLSLSRARVIACDTEMSMQHKRVFADEWWKYNWNINRIFHTSRDLPKAIIAAALFAFINIYIYSLVQHVMEWSRERKLMLLRSDWLTQFSCWSKRISFSHSHGACLQ